MNISTSINWSNSAKGQMALICLEQKGRISTKWKAQFALFCSCCTRLLVQINVCCANKIIFLFKNHLFHLRSAPYHKISTTLIAFETIFHFCYSFSIVDGFFHLFENYKLCMYVCTIISTPTTLTIVWLIQATPQNAHSKRKLRRWKKEEEKKLHIDDFQFMQNTL